MTTLTHTLAQELRHKAGQFLKAASLLTQVDHLMGGGKRRRATSANGSRRGGKRTLSVAGRKAIALAQKRRWAKLRAQKAQKAGK